MSFSVAEFRVLGESTENLHGRQSTRPSDISVRPTGATGRFGKLEVEVSAGRLVLFFQRKKGDLWAGFHLQELMKFYEENLWDPNLVFFGFWCSWLDMASPQWMSPDQVLLVQDDRGVFHVTNRFIEACQQH
ncbi:MAG: hypothetical protein NUW02_00410 [Candidatus Campbellbacteria bacterium]|nr:hypothetical protein [Candidatus Campbellbacteria bacterium]